MPGENSDFATTLSGVPQRSNMGPLLFLIYINDLANVMSSVPRLFADDTCIHASSSNAKKLENDINIELKLIHNWS